MNNYSVTQDTTLDITIPAKKLSVRVQDAAGNPIANSEVHAGNATIANADGLAIGGNITNANGSASYSSPAIKTDSSGNVTLWLIPTNNNNSYSLTAFAPSGTNYENKILSNYKLTDDSNLTINLVRPVTLSGHVYDPLGNPLSNQNVSLIGSGGNSVASAVTDSAGKYSLLASSGTYHKFQVDVSTGSGNSLSVNVPQYYLLYALNYTITQDTVVDVKIPAKKVSLHVQDPLGKPVKDMVVNAGNSTVANAGGLSMANTISNATGQASYTSSNVKTNESGNVDLWLLPTDIDHFYTLTLLPPAGSIYSPITLNNFSVTTDQNEVISLQYNHAAPVTAIDLATQHTDGTYSDPTTVTLSAVADSGYSVANTYYKVDGGVQQTYSGPFTVSGEGEHVVSYWSVDNSGVQEAVKSKTFTIYVNQAPYVDPLSPVTVSEGATFAAGGSFTDDDSDAWTGTVDYGDGSAKQNLVLNGTSFNLNHSYQDNGTYTVSVEIKDNQQSVGRTSFEVTVSNAAPVVGAITASINPVQVGVQTSAQAVVTDAGVLDTHTAVWQWGDGLSSAGIVSNGTVSGSHTYAAAGVYEITLVVTDDDGGVGAAPVYQYLTVFDPNAGWIAGSKEFVSPQGALVSNPSVAGTVDFGFQVKYQQGDVVPSGKNIEFSFPDGNLEFVSTGYQWLTVNGQKATFKATGTLNGIAGYTILVSAIDQGTGQQRGAIRIQIKNGNTVIYDTQPGAAETADPLIPVTKGKIAVH